MTVLRILNVIVWGLLLLYMVPGAWSAGFGAARRSDPMQLAIFITALIMCGFSLRFLLMPDNEFAWRALYVLAAADAVYIGVIFRIYGRGPRL